MPPRRYTGKDFLSVVAVRTRICRRYPRAHLADRFPGSCSHTRNSVCPFVEFQNAVLASVLVRGFVLLPSASRACGRNRHTSACAASRSMRRRSVAREAARRACRSVLRLHPLSPRPFPIVEPGAVLRGFAGDLLLKQPLILGLGGRRWRSAFSASIWSIHSWYAVSTASSSGV